MDQNRVANTRFDTRYPVCYPGTRVPGYPGKSLFVIYTYAIMLLELTVQHSGRRTSAEMFNSQVGHMMLALVVHYGGSARF